MDNQVRVQIEQFLQSSAYAVAGASANRAKFGNKVLRCYLQHNKTVYPLNPNEASVEGLNCIANISDLPSEVQSLSVVTPPAITEKIVEQAITHGIKNIWLQPGAESEAAISKGKEHGINIIAGGPCILAYLGFHE
jgi:predicted CoA-binding protein